MKKTIIITLTANKFHNKDQITIKIHIWKENGYKEWINVPKVSNNSFGKISSSLGSKKMNNYLNKLRSSNQKQIWFNGNKDLLTLCSNLTGLGIILQCKCLRNR